MSEGGEGRKLFSVSVVWRKREGRVLEIRGVVLIYLRTCIAVLESVGGVMSTRWSSP